MKIKRFKRIYEDETPQQNPQQPAQQPAQQQQAAQPAQQQPAQQNPQQGQQQQQQQPQQNQYAQKVTDLLKKMENTYWIMSINLPEEIQKEIPDFKQGNQAADPIIKLWNDFKQNPDEAKFNAFVDAFKNFGNPQPAEGQEGQQQQAVNAGLIASYSFRHKLMENLNKAKAKKHYNDMIQSYFDNSED